MEVWSKETMENIEPLLKVTGLKFFKKNKNYVPSCIVPCYRTSYLFSVIAPVFSAASPYCDVKY